MLNAFAPTEQIELHSISSFYLDKRASAASATATHTDLRNMKAEIATYAQELEVVDMPEVKMTVPSDKYNVVILGD